MRKSLQMLWISYQRVARTMKKERIELQWGNGEMREYLLYEHSNHIYAPK